ncbi:transcription elongation factor, mitochondrial-like [Stylophora pistillata]|uniref:Transcription elongation factor, mitochondrial n=1 Tax=Stylophora pistillata TaxID=50429 RepID=A0A2B4RMP0_STYPI|nr:transcription elongation factor, mitochondrial-like [Stylophora pistillata]PFX17780.1 Transcription elongation factor, mitochondrial [Stylophora pistillata]
MNPLGMNILRSVEAFVKMNRLASGCATYSAVCRRCKVRCPSPRALLISIRGSASTTSITNAAEKEEKTDPQSILKTKTIGTVEVDLPDTKKQEILNQLNSRSLEELSNTKGIGKVKAVSIIEYRNNFGPFQSVEDLFQMKGFGAAFFKNLEDAGSLAAVKRKTSKGLETIWEQLAQNKKDVISEIVSIDIGFQNAAWVHMDKDKKVLGWSRAEIIKPKPYNPAVFQPLVQQFVNRVPKTDIYVVEMQSHRIGKQTAALLPFAVHLRVFEAMLTCLLPGLVIPFDPLYTSKHFCLPVGRTKKRAAVNLVESLFQDRKNEEPFEAQCEQFLKEQQGMEGSEDFVESFIDGQMSGFPGNISKPLLQVSPKFVNYFKSCDKKDDLSDCLLQALAFYDLVVKNRKQSRM